MKKSIKKALKGDGDPYLKLLAVCTSPGPENNTPPTTLFYNRTIRTLIPSMKHTTSSPQYPKSNGQIEGTNQK